MKNKAAIIVLLTLWFGIGETARCEKRGFDVKRDGSIFAVVTHKAGIGAALAHNHLVYPAEYEVQITAEGKNEIPDEITFKLNFPVENLTTDEPDMLEKWFPHIKEAGIQDEPFRGVNENDRKKIRKSMLGPGQLDSSRFPDFKAELLRVFQEKSQRGNLSFNYKAEVKISLHGKEKSGEFSANIKRKEDGSIHVLGVGEFNFTDFNIEPYSAFLGAFRNKDRFHVFVDFIAVPANEE